ncbi:MAG: hypothetical protein L0196_05645 [candidate division Zixibacteria bacterium]|nr:hypothetical protein [candidate division Zixibacteria bacterium]
MEVNLDFEDTATGTEVPESLITGDKTITGGFYQVILPDGIYFVSFKPPVGARLVGKRFFVDLSTHRLMDTVFLPIGFFVSGTVTDSVGAPILGVDLDFTQLPNKERIFTPRDNTDSVGFYRVVVPPGIFRVRFDSPPGSRFRGLQKDTVPVSKDTVMDALLVTGLVLSGRAVDSLDTGVPSLSVDLEDTAGKEIFLSNNRSDSLGNFRVITPPGTFSLLLIPPRGNRLIPKEIEPFSIFADTSILETFRVGVLLSVTVKDSLGNPIQNCDLDVIREFPSRNELFTPTDNADSLGVIKVAVPPDSYTLVISPPLGTAGFDTLMITGVKVLSDFDTAVVLTGEPLHTPVSVETRILEARPNPFRPEGGNRIKFPVDLDVVSGVWKISLTIFSPVGEIIYRSRTEFSGGGRQVLEWDGLNQSDQPVASGVYFCKIVLEKPGNSRKTEKVLKVAVIR